MNQQFTAINRRDAYGNPEGGYVFMGVLGDGTMLDGGIDGDDLGDAPAIFIRWQAGPLAVDGVRREPNGAFVETVLQAVRQRLMEYQETQHSCVENDEAIGGIDIALGALNRRTAAREALGIEGTLITNHAATSLGINPAAADINPNLIEPSHPAQSPADLTEGADPAPAGVTHPPVEPAAPAEGEQTEPTSPDATGSITTTIEPAAPETPAAPTEPAKDAPEDKPAKVAGSTKKTK